MEGYGNKIKSFKVDGKKADPTLSYNLKGVHTIQIVLANRRPDIKKINSVEHYVTLPAPIVSINGKELSWSAVNGAKGYKVVRNGKLMAVVKETSFSIIDDLFGEYSVMAVDEKEVESFGSEPVVFTGNSFVQTIELENAIAKSTLSYNGFLGEGFVEISKKENLTINIPVTLPEDGIYTIDFRYANGNGPTNTENKCALRTLKEGNIIVGTVVLPQRGKEEWSNWGWSNTIPVRLTKGTHQLTLSLDPQNENMNGDINQAMLDQLRIIKIN